jgi:hypothetical protein
MMAMMAMVMMSDGARWTRAEKGGKAERFNELEEETGRERESNCCFFF